MKKWIIIFLMTCSLQVSAQEKIVITEDDYSNSRIEMADIMRSEGKIYVLVGVIVLIFGGITAYVINTDRKVAKLEKLIKEES
ncbi:CcmD family protein [Mongoliibacter sp.]|uniref:CcmD family protein n=1 Tax=Mongoliibacter sp. TaxID=2022438 RepID=UPI0025CBBBEB|nr:CcmD family protein [Mongoliibacter sp.]